MALSFCEAVGYSISENSTQGVVFGRNWTRCLVVRESAVLRTAWEVRLVAISKLHDGSGLASSNVITPRAFVRLLDFMENHPNNAPFMRGLPRSGGRGSLARRFLETPLEGLVTAKTGGIYHVNSLNGYVDTRGGRVKFSVMVNSHTAGSSAATRRIDEFLVALLR